MSDNYDYIIIGSGFGGSVSALRLAEKGYKVLLVEQGKRFENEDYARNNWQLRKYLWWPSLGMYGIQKLSFYKEASIMTGTGVGGGSLVYANTLFIPENGFFTKGKWAAMRDWKSTLEPHYKKASAMMGRVPYDRMNPEDLLLQEVAKEMGKEKTFRNVHVGVYFSDREDACDPYFNGEGPLRKPCIECAACMVGCREGAKNTLDKNYLWMAEKKGAEILAETRVVHIENEMNEYRVHLRSMRSRRITNVLRTSRLIVSAGTLGTLDLLLKMKYKTRSLNALSHRLGENLLTNSETLCAVSGISQKMNNGVAISSVFHPDENTHVEIVKYPDRSNSLKWFFSLAIPGAKTNFQRTLKLLGKILTSPIQFSRMFFRKNWSTGLVIFLVMQSLENSMKMIWKNRWLRPGISIVNSGSQKVPAFIEIGQQVMMRYAGKSNGTPQNIILEVLFNRPTTAHILGGVPMGKDDKDSVVNDKLEVHNYPGMYIIDGSILQTNPGVNPSLSILAMAEYAMDLIPEKQNEVN